jgi:putative transcriptional regulator
MQINAEEIVKIRKRTGFTQAGFAIKLNISLSSLKKWERGVRHPEAAAVTLLKLIDKNPDLLNEIDHEQD